MPLEKQVKENLDSLKRIAAVATRAGGYLQIQPIIDDMSANQLSLPLVSCNSVTVNLKEDLPGLYDKTIELLQACKIKDTQDVLKRASYTSTAIACPTAEFVPAYCNNSWSERDIVAIVFSANKIKVDSLLVQPYEAMTCLGRQNNDLDALGISENSETKTHSSESSTISIVFLHFSVDYRSMPTFFQKAQIDRAGSRTLDSVEVYQVVPMLLKTANKLLDSQAENIVDLMFEHAQQLQKTALPKLCTKPLTGSTDLFYFIQDQYHPRCRLSAIKSCIEAKPHLNVTCKNMFNNPGQEQVILRFLDVLPKHHRYPFIEYIKANGVELETVFTDGLNGVNLLLRRLREEDRQLDIIYNFDMTKIIKNADDFVAILIDIPEENRNLFLDTHCHHKEILEVMKATDLEKCLNWYSPKMDKGERDRLIESVEFFLKVTNEHKSNFGFM